MLIEVVDSRRADCPIIYYESDVIPSKGDSVSMNKTKQYTGFMGIMSGVPHGIYAEGLEEYLKTKSTAVLEMVEEDK